MLRVSTSAVPAFRKGRRVSDLLLDNEVANLIRWQEFEAENPVLHCTIDTRETDDWKDFYFHERQLSGRLKEQLAEEQARTRQLEYAVQARDRERERAFRNRTPLWVYLVGVSGYALGLAGWLR